MSLLGAMLNRAPTTKTPVPLVGRSQGGLFGSLLRMPAAAQQLSAMEASGTVFNIVDRLATAVAKAEWKLWRKAKSGKPEDRTEVTSHLALDIWNKPNDFMTGQELREAAQQHQDLTGEGWLVVGRDERARSIPLELWPVRPDRMEPLPSAEAYLLGYLYRSPDGEQVPLERQDVLFMRRPDPTNPYRGLGPIKAILTDIDSSKFAAEWNRNFFLNSAEPGGIVEVEKRLSDDEFDEMTARWAEQHKGISRAHSVAILEQAKWVDRKYSMRDMQFTELRGVTSSALREAFGYPKFMAGLVDDVNRATAEASKAMFAEWLVVPRLDRWKQMANFEYLPLFGATAEDLEFDYVSPVPEDSEAENAARTSKTTAVATLVPLGFDAPKCLEVFGLPDIPWKKPEPVAPPMGGFGGGKQDPKADPLMALWAGQLLDHLPDRHDQRSHGRTRARLAAADERLMADRLGWKSVGWGMTPAQRLADARQAAQGDDAEALQARGSLLQARYDLQRDRANVLARTEAVAFINEWIDDHPSGMRGTFNVERLNRKVDDDPRLEALGEALDSGDRTRILRALKKTADDAGLTRIGGDPRRGPDQMLAFDPRTHQSIGGLIRPGQKAILVRPGYSTKDDSGETVVLERAVVEEAYPEDIARIQGSAVPQLLAQAPTDDSELALVQADWEDALNRLLAEWRRITAAQRAEIRRQVRAAVENGDVEALADIELPHEEASAVLLAALIVLAAIAGGRMASELAAAGAPLVAPAVLGPEALAPIATAAAVLLAGGFAVAAAAAAVSALRPAAPGAPSTTPAQVVASVDTALDGLSDRALRDHLGGALTTAQNMARLLTARTAEEELQAITADLRITYIATEKLDANTCWQCHNIDGTEYESWIAAWIDYAGGKYRGCEGRNRCRGTIKARVEDIGNGGQEPEQTPPEPTVDDVLEQLLVQEDDEEPQRVRVGVGR